MNPTTLLIVRELRCRLLNLELRVHVLDLRSLLFQLCDRRQYARSLLDCDAQIHRAILAESVPVAVRDLLRRGRWRRRSGIRLSGLRFGTECCGRYLRFVLLTLPLAL